ncbi:peptide transporter [Asaia sp. W19]|uniref:tetratricopeptide repeat protein n=1 Tax=unclassified Asaia TaxID=2685023 RepID=UPI000F8D04FF|nr:tetratricopeptide repeat protein [Asaia sp. W19]RUT24525.1 peptide transporter [Asaia sp. W19]
MPSLQQASYEELHAAFRSGDTMRCLEAARFLDRASSGGLHPLGQLMPHAEAADRRADLLALVEALADHAPYDCRLLELRGSLLLQIGRLDEAIDALTQALSRRPAHLPAMGVLASAYTQAGRFPEAREVLQKIHDLDPGDPSSVSNIAYLTAAMGDMIPALNLYRRAIMQRPDHPQMRLNYSIALLKAGFYQQGWAEHEWRFQLPGHTSLPLSRLLPTLTPGLDLNGKHVLVTQEEGYGDTFMYLRYLPLLARHGARIRVWGADIMADLCARVEGVEAVQFGGETPPYDYHCPFISLPRVFSASETPFGAAVPYISADKGKSARFSALLKKEPSLRVGLVWSGAPRRDQTEAFMLDQRRSMALETLRPLFGLADVSFYSLQKGDAARQLDEGRLRGGPSDGLDTGITDLMPHVETMDDSAALIDNLDVVVSVDTSMVHLAGAMGKTVLLMDRVNPCWRWLTDRQDSPWYPSLTIYRQQRAWDWGDVVSSVRDRLIDEAKRKRS